MNPRFTKRLLAIAIVSTLFACSEEPMTDKAAVAEPAPIVSPAVTAAVNPFAEASKLALLAPDFSKIKDSDYAPAMTNGMAQQMVEIEAIANSTEAPSFENTIVAMERSGLMLTRVTKVFFNLTESTSNETIQTLQGEFAPKLAAHNDSISLNPKLFARIQAIYDAKDSLSGEDKRLVEVYYRNFVRAGAQLGDAEKLRLAEINSSLSSLGTQFSQNVQKDTLDSALLVDDVKQLDGMSEEEIAGAAEAAKAKGQEGKYLITLANFTLQPQLAYLKDRATRQRLYEASVNRGKRGNAFDTQALIKQIAALRVERAQLLGFKTYADYGLDNQMAKTPEVANKIMMDTAGPTLLKAKAEAVEIQAAIKADGQSFTLEPWDWSYYSEKVRSAKYGLDESVVKPYFEFENVLQNGMFYAMNLQFGITIKERKDLPVYHPEVRTFDVAEEDGTQIGVIYLDYFARDSKRGGAWMDSFVDQTTLLGQKPVVLNVMNIKKAPAGQQTLLSFDEVSTMFHEFGHGVHGLFSNVKYPTLSGTSTPRDFVEFPSQYQEDWALDSKVLANYAKHYKTGEAMPQALLDKIRKAAGWNKGFEGLEALQAQMLDMDWHTMSLEQIKQVDDVVAFEDKVLISRGVSFGPIRPRYGTTYFGHVWPGGYAAGYYAYLWTEVLAADAFAYASEKGPGISREWGDKFRAAVLSKGGTDEAMTLYKNFRGQEPTVDGLLKRRGLK
jgi:peptidyl-dipeptidase Dcp